MRAERVKVFAGHVKRFTSMKNWVTSSVSQIYVHENYLMDKVYNDIALLKVSVNTLV